LNDVDALTAAEVAQTLVSIGRAWAKSRGLKPEQGIAAMTEAVAAQEIKMFKENGTIMWSLK